MRRHLSWTQSKYPAVQLLIKPMKGALRIYRKTSNGTHLLEAMNKTKILLKNTMNLKETETPSDKKKVIALLPKRVLMSLRGIIRKREKEKVIVLMMEGSVRSLSQMSQREMELVHLRVQACFK